MTDYAKAAIFYGLTLAQSIALALFAAPVVGHFTLLMVMMTPFVSVLIMKLIVTREGYTWAGWSDLGFNSLGLKSWPIAIGLPFLVLLFAYAVVWGTGIAQFVIPEGYVITPLDFTLNLVITMTVCFGEEIGWRGYLLPKLMKLGHRPALLLSGLLQGLWHVPLIVFTSLYHGDGNLWITIPLFLATMTIAGILFGYLRLASGSTVPAVIAHGVFNIYWDLFVRFSISSTPLVFEYLAGESGLLTLLAVAVSAYVLIRRMENPRSGIVLAAA